MLLVYGIIHFIPSQYAPGEKNILRLMNNESTLYKYSVKIIMKS